MKSQTRRDFLKQFTYIGSGIVLYPIIQSTAHESVFDNCSQTASGKIVCGNIAF